MKIMMMTDMEGCAGVLSHDEWVRRDGQFYDKGLRLLTEEVNAAIDGLYSGGAQEVVVIDGHGQGGIDPEILDERVELVRGGGWPFELDDTFDGLAFVGQHAKAGTPYSHITHTMWFNYIDVTVNGISVGEYGMFALCAMELGVPAILACGEQAFAEEATALTPGVVAVGVKRGLMPDGLDDLDADAYRLAKLGAVHKSPATARRLIGEGALQAMATLKRDPGSFRHPQLTPPYTRIIRFRQFGEVLPYETRDEHPDSLIALLNMPIAPGPRA